MRKYLARIIWRMEVENLRYSELRYVEDDIEDLSETINGPKRIKSTWKRIWFLLIKR
jgi:hypothetical protein